MKAQAIRHLLLTGPRRWRLRIADALRGTALWRPARAVYRGWARLTGTLAISSAVSAVERRLYESDPRGYWQREGGRQYLEDEAFLLGPGSITEHQARFLADEIRALGAGSVLEVGCGYGRLLREIGATLDVPLVGVDFSEAQLTTARQYLAHRNISLVLSDATEGLPFRDAAFDLIYTQGSLMHVPPPLDRAYRRELVRVARRYIVHTEEVRDGGHVFSYDSEGHYREMGCPLLKTVPYPFNPPGHTLRFQVFEVGRGNDR